MMKEALLAAGIVLSLVGLALLERLLLTLFRH
jgi:hypothetical protein